VTIGYMSILGARISLDRRVESRRNGFTTRVLTRFRFIEPGGLALM
jgi:hypothetical protein